MLGFKKRISDAEDSGACDLAVAEKAEPSTLKGRWQLACEERNRINEQAAILADEERIVREKANAERERVKEARAAHEAALARYGQVATNGGDKASAGKVVDETEAALQVARRGEAIAEAYDAKADDLRQRRAELELREPNLGQLRNDLQLAQLNLLIQDTNHCYGVISKQLASIGIELLAIEAVAVGFGIKTGAQSALCGLNGLNIPNLLHVRLAGGRPSVLTGATLNMDSMRRAEIAHERERIAAILDSEFEA